VEYDGIKYSVKTTALVKIENNIHPQLLRNQLKLNTTRSWAMHSFTIQK
jgi:hypothetical protein